MDRASIIAIEEVCKRCHQYTKHCGMLEYPSQCVHSGYFIDGYRKAEQDLALTWENVASLFRIMFDYHIETGSFNLTDEALCKEVLKRFNEQKKMIPKKGL